MDLQGLSSQLLLVSATIGVAPLLIASATSFLKIAVTLSLVRNALGVQQIPPNVVIYSIALALSLYVMGPTILATISALEPAFSENPPESLAPILIEASKPLTDFMERNADADHAEFFTNKLDEMWNTQEVPLPEALDGARRFFALLPAFAFSELGDAFKIGFLIYLPFLAIDIVISNILLALGMMMVSPVTIGLPFKLLLFVSVDGWTRLAQALISGYV